MRLIDALAVSAAIHAGMLALPTGDLSLRPEDARPSRSEPLRAELRRIPAKPEKASETFQSVPEPLPAPPEIATESEPTKDGLADTVGSGFGIPLPYYYGPREVSERPKPVHEINLEPPELRGVPGHGKLVLKLWINEVGTVDRVEVETSQVADTMEKVITEQFRQATFAPAQIDGKAVKSRMKIEVVVKPPSAYIVPPPPPLPPKPASAAEN